MENLETKMTIFFAKKVILSLIADKSNYLFIFKMGKQRYDDVVEFLLENNEISKEEQEELEKVRIVFDFE